jgi:zinc protease
MFCAFVLLLGLQFIGSQSAFAETTEKTLENGLRVIVKPDHRARVVTSQIWYKVGSGDEPQGITGISHALEHMMFQGTALHPKGEFSRMIAEAGGNENAATTRDYTVYYQTVSADQLSLCFSLEADRMQHLMLSPDNFKREKEVIKEERRLRTDDNPQALFFEKISQMIFKNMSYEHAPIGWLRDIDHLQVSDLQQWYQQHYAPNNAIIIVVGDVKPKKVFEAAEHYFGHIPKQNLLARPSALPVIHGPNNVLLHLSAQWPWVTMGFYVPSLATATDRLDAYTLVVLSAILNDGNPERLTGDLVRRQAMAVRASTSYDLVSRLGGLFFVTATPLDKQKIPALEKALLNHIERLKTQTISDAELARVKTSLIANYLYDQDEMAAQADLLGELAILDLPISLVDDFKRNVQQVTAGDCQRVAKKYLTASNRMIGILQADVPVVSKGK